VLFRSGTNAFFRYVPSSDVLIHNANALAGGAIARVSRLAHNEDLAEVASRAAMTTVALQRQDGSWPYGEEASLSWIDGFHTAYTLAGLEAVNGVLPDDRIKDAIARGKAFYRRACFRVDAVPRYYADKQVVGDCHTAATAIRYFAGSGEDIGFAVEIYEWARETLRLADGSFRTSAGNPIPYLRWSEAHMFLALAELRRAVTSENKARSND